MKKSSKTKEIAQEETAEIKTEIKNEPQTITWQYIYH